jgi:predicted DNA-binding transcriptional regulator AlpA
MTNAHIDPVDALRVVSEPTAAGILGVSPDTLKRMVARGQGPRRLKISQRRVGYRLSDVMAWLNQRDDASSSE